MLTVKSADGTSIAYDKAGVGPAVILVAGAFSYRKFPMLQKLVAELAPRFTVYNYDRRGRGDSGDTQPYAVQREIEDLRALVEVAGGTANVWGLSAGAILSLRAAAAGVPMTKLAVYDPPFRVDAKTPLPPADFAAHLEKLVAAGERGEAVKYMMTKGFGAPGFAVAVMRLLPVWKNLTGLAHTLPYDTAILGSAASGRPLSPEEWGPVKVPTLAIAGGKAPAAIQTGTRALADVLPDATYQVLSGQSHNVSAKALAPLLSDFFGQ